MTQLLKKEKKNIYNSDERIAWSFPVGELLFWDLITWHILIATCHLQTGYDAMPP